MPPVPPAKSYLCSEPSCGKTFGTAGHVRRHERTHSDLQPYACTQCAKRFARSDVLARHVTALHGQDVIGRSSGSNSSRRTPSYQVLRGAKSPAPGISGSNFTGDNMLNRDGIDTSSPQPPGSTTLTTSSNLRPAISHFLDTTQGEMSQRRMSHASSLYMDARGTFDLVEPNTSLDNARIGREDDGGLGQVQDHMAGTDVIATGSRTMYPPSFLQSHQPNPVPFSPWTAFNDVFGWGLDNADAFEPDLSTFSMGFGTDMLDAAWLLCSGGGGGGGGGDMAGGRPAQSTSTEAMHGHVTGAIAGIGRGLGGDTVGEGNDNVDNPWPHVFHPNAADRPLTLSAPALTARPSPTVASLFNYDVDFVSSASRNAMLSLIHLSHQAHWSFANIDDFPSAETLNSCVNLYFLYFHPTFPVIRPTALKDASAPAVLLLAAAAIGATYAKDDLKSLAVGLNELVRRMLTYLRASDQRAKFERSTTQAYLLQAIFGIACGSRELYLHSEITRCSLVTACRRLHLLKATTTLPSTPDGTLLTPEERHRAYVEEEEKRRLGWGIYLFDAQIAVLFNTPCLFAISELGGAHLPGDDELWNITRTSSWLAIVEDQPDIEQPLFLDVLSSLLSDAKLKRPLNDFGSALIAHTLYRLCLDAYSLSRALSGGDASAATKTSTALLLCFPPVLNIKPQVILDRLAVSWHYASAHPKALMVSTAALSHHSHIQFTRPGFLEHVRQAAGKYEPDPRRQPAREWLYQWSRREPEEARTIVVHAAQLNALLARFTFDTFPEVLWTLDCALALWGIIKLGPNLIEGADSVSGGTTVKWSDHVVDIRWISNGGPVTFQSLGSWSDMTVSGLLAFFINKLRNMPWGLTELYVQVLERLLDEEVDGADTPTLRDTLGNMASINSSEIYP